MEPSRVHVGVQLFTDGANQSTSLPDSPSSSPRRLFPARGGLWCRPDATGFFADTEQSRSARGPRARIDFSNVAPAGHSFVPGHPVQPPRSPTSRDPESTPRVPDAQLQRTAMRPPCPSSALTTSRTRWRRAGARGAAARLPHLPAQDARANRATSSASARRASPLHYIQARQFYQARRPSKPHRRRAGLRALQVETAGHPRARHRHCARRQAWRPRTAASPRRHAAAAPTDTPARGDLRPSPG